MMTWLVRIVVGLIVIGIVVFVVGSLLPQNHTASRTESFSQPPETVWAAITDVAAFPTWRKEVASVVQLAPQNDKPVWRETSHRGESITYAAETWEPPRHLVTRITDKNLPFGGSWDYALAPSGAGSTLTITEHGEIYNPVFKVVSRFMSKTATMDAYLTALKAKLGSG
jgi:uncharacterized protein YndB with AHSA1/START domain